MGFKQRVSASKGSTHGQTRTPNSAKETDASKKSHRRAKSEAQTSKAKETAAGTQKPRGSALTAGRDSKRSQRVNKYAAAIKTARSNSPTKRTQRNSSPMRSISPMRDISPKNLVTDANRSLEMKEKLEEERQARRRVHRMPADKGKRTVAVVKLVRKKDKTEVSKLDSLIDTILNENEDQKSKRKGLKASAKEVLPFSEQRRGGNVNSPPVSRFLRSRSFKRSESISNQSSRSQSIPRSESATERNKSPPQTVAMRKEVSEFHKRSVANPHQIEEEPPVGYETSKKFVQDENHWAWTNNFLALCGYHAIPTHVNEDAMEAESQVSSVTGFSEHKHKAFSTENMLTSYCQWIVLQAFNLFAIERTPPVPKEELALSVPVTNEPTSTPRDQEEELHRSAVAQFSDNTNPEARAEKYEKKHRHGAAVNNTVAESEVGKAIESCESPGISTEEAETFPPDTSSNQPSWSANNGEKSIDKKWFSFLPAYDSNLLTQASMSSVEDSQNSSNNVPIREVNVSTSVHELQYSRSWPMQSSKDVCNNTEEMESQSKSSVESKGSTLPPPLRSCLKTPKSEAKDGKANTGAIRPKSEPLRSCLKKSKDDEKEVNETKIGAPKNEANSGSLRSILKTTPSLSKESEKGSSKSIDKAVGTKPPRVPSRSGSEQNDAGHVKKGKRPMGPLRSFSFTSRSARSNWAIKKSNSDLGAAAKSKPAVICQAPMDPRHPLPPALDVSTELEFEESPPSPSNLLIVESRSMKEEGKERHQLLPRIIEEIVA